MSRSLEGHRQKHRCRTISTMQQKPKEDEKGVTYHFDKADGRFGVLVVYERCMEWEVYDKDPGKFPFARKIDYQDPDLFPEGLQWKEYTNLPLEKVVDMRRMSLLELVSILLSKGYEMRDYYIENGSKVPI